MMNLLSTCSAVLVALCFTRQLETVSASLAQGNTKDAYVTLQFGNFLLGARVLGQSIRETGTTKDLVVLCSETVSENAKRILEADGWKIRPIEKVRKSKGWGYFDQVFSKLHIWNMTDYERIVYLDSDALVLSNIDHMFDCGTFCVTYRHSDFFNAGVIVVEPSKHVYDDLVRMSNEVPSWKEDQVLLNAYFRDVRSTPMFNWSDNTRQQKPMRLQAGLNPDTVAYYLHSRWLIPQEELKVIHYTIGPVSKPWVWWTTYLFDLNWKWNEVRNRLPRHIELEDSFQVLFTGALFFAPYLLLAAFFASLNLCGSTVAKYAPIGDKLPHATPVAFLLLSYFLTYKFIVPSTMVPSHAKYVFSLWSQMLLVIFFGTYCRLCHLSNNGGQTVVPRKKMLKLYTIFLASYIILGIVPPIVQTFYMRLIAAIVLAIVHILVCQVVGQRVIRMWSGPRKIENYSILDGVLNKII